MKNRNKKNQGRQPVPPPPDPVRIVGISKRGWKVILTGIAVLAAGFFVLTRTDPYGQNWASTLSPFLILGGYALIGFGIVVPEKAVPSN